MKDGHLARKLFWIVLIKLAALFVLWFAFIREQLMPSSTHPDATLTAVALIARHGLIA